MPRQSSRVIQASFASLTCCAVAMCVLARPASASWPSSAEAPLLVGAASVPSSSRAAIVRSTTGVHWASWIDSQCSGSLRVQRIDASGTLLVPDGLVLQTFPGCHTTSALAAACGDGSVIAARAESNHLPLAMQQIHRVADDGTPMWGDGIAVDESANGRILALAGVGEGDALVAWTVGTTLFVQRYDVDGQPVWSEPASLTSLVVNLTILPDDAGGVVMVWDFHAVPSYFRVIRAMRIAGDGTMAWAEPVTVTPESPFATRHSLHSFLPDGEGGIWVIYARGGNQIDLPVPILVQRVLGDGTLAFAEPARVALEQKMQFAPTAWRDDVSGDLYVAWRHDVFPGPTTLRVQRLTESGTRLFGDNGLVVAPAATAPASHAFQSLLTVGAITDAGLTLVSATAPVSTGEPRVRAHLVSSDGVVDGGPIPLSGDENGFALVNSSMADGSQVVLWFRATGTFAAAPVAQLVQSDGSLGLPTPKPILGDLNGDGVVDAADLGILLAAWGRCVGCAADLNGDGIVDGEDLGLLLGAWTE